MYTCDQCGYNTESNARFTRHLNRKTKCAPVKRSANATTVEPASASTALTTEPYISVKDNTITTVVNNVTTNTTINNKIKLKFGDLIVDLEDVPNPVIRARIQKFVDDMMVKHQIRQIIENNFSHNFFNGNQNFEMNFD